MRLKREEHTSLTSGLSETVASSRAEASAFADSCRGAEEEAAAEREHAFARREEEAAAHAAAVGEAAEEARKDASASLERTETGEGISLYPPSMVLVSRLSILHFLRMREVLLGRGRLEGFFREVRRRVLLPARVARVQVPLRPGGGQEGAGRVLLADAEEGRPHGGDARQGAHPGQDLPQGDHKGAASFLPSAL